MPTGPAREAPLAMLAASRCKDDTMLRPGITIEQFHQRQQGMLPGQFGVRIVRIDEKRMDSEMTIAPWMHAPNGFLHAASVIALADSTAGYASVAHLPEGAKGFTTIELKSNFLGTAREGVLRCECVGEHVGRSTHVWSATVFSPEGRRIALFRCTQMILW